MESRFTRRAALAALAAAGVGRSSAQVPTVDRGAVQRNDAGVERLLRSQITDPSSHWCGSVPDEFNLHAAGTAGALIDAMTASLICPQSKFHGDRMLVQ